MIALLLTILLTVVCGQGGNHISDAQKKSFIELVKTLPVKGEFFKDEAIEKAGPYMPVLFALSEKDIEKYDIYPFFALSRALCDRKSHRSYAVRHFSEIRHSELKLGWGAMLFDAGATSPEVVRYLKDALESESQTKVLAEMLGPEYEHFQRRVRSFRSGRLRKQRA